MQRRPLMQRWADFLMDFETDTAQGTDCPQEEKDTP